jgi:hypothetical protein
VVNIADTAVARRASVNDAAGTRAQITAASPDRMAFVPLVEISAAEWQALAERAIEPLLPASVGTGGERFRARPDRRVGAERME